MGELVVRIGFSLVVVLGLMWLLAKLARRPLAGRGGAAMSVLARQQLTRNASVAVVKIVDQALIVGVTDGQISLLGEADLETVERRLAEPTERRDEVRLDRAAPGKAPLAVRPAQDGKLSGSVLSPQTWGQAVDFLRERTARR